MINNLVYKTAYCFFFFFLCITITVTAKERLGVDFGLGIKGGLNFNKVKGSEWKDVFSTDPHAGFFMFLNKHRLGIQLEAVWTQNRMTTDSSFYGLYKQYYNQAIDSLTNNTFRFSTISIPILLNIKLAKFLWIQVGPQYSSNIQMIDQKNVIKSGVDIIKEGSFNMIGGLWLQLGGDSPVIRVNAGVRYISGVNNLNNLLTVDQQRPEWRNQMIQVHLGFTY